MMTNQILIDGLEQIKGRLKDWEGRGNGDPPWWNLCDTAAAALKRYRAADPANSLTEAAPDLLAACQKLVASGFPIGGYNRKDLDEARRAAAMAIVQAESDG